MAEQQTDLRRSKVIVKLTQEMERWTKNWSGEKTQKRRVAMRKLSCNSSVVFFLTTGYFRIVLLKKKFFGLIWVTIEGGDKEGLAKGGEEAATVEGGQAKKRL